MFIEKSALKSLPGPVHRRQHRRRQVPPAEPRPFRRERGVRHVSRAGQVVEKEALRHLNVINSLPQLHHGCVGRAVQPPPVGRLGHGGTPGVVEQREPEN